MHRTGDETSLITEQVDREAGHVRGLPQLAQGRAVTSLVTAERERCVQTARIPLRPYSSATARVNASTPALLAA